MIDMKFSGGPELAKALNALSAELKPLVLYEGLKEAGEPMRAEMSRLVRRSSRAGSKHIADNISISKADKVEGIKVHEDEVAVKIGPAKGTAAQYFYYGFFIEYGTIKMGAHPFMRPAFDQHVKGVLDAMKAIYWRLITGNGEVKTR